MSDFLKDPTFQPTEDVRSFIDSLFAEAAPVDLPKDLQAPAYELKLPDVTPLSQADMKLALQIAEDEMEEFRDKLMKFCDSVSGMAIYSYLFPDLEDFGEACEDLFTLVQDKFDTNKLTEAGLERYKEAGKVRMGILSAILKAYRKNGEAE